MKLYRPSLYKPPQIPGPKNTNKKKKFLTDTCGMP